MNRAGLAPQTRARAILFTVGVATLGAVLNLVPVPLGVGLTLVLGNSAFLVVAAWLGPRFALPAAMLVAAPLLWMWGHPAGLIVFSVEGLVVGMLCERGMRLFYADMLFWVLLGVPLYALLARVLSTAPADYVLALCVKHVFNGALNASIAALAILAVGSRGLAWLPRRDRGGRHSLRGRMVYVMTLVIAFTMAITTLLTTRSTIRYQEELIRSRLAETVAHLARRTEEYLSSHRSAVSLLADLLSMSANRAELLQPMLLEERRHYPGFLSMLGLDADARIVAAAPLERVQAAREGVFPVVADRDYFREAIVRDEVYESGVFRSRGIFTEPVIAISRRFRDGAQGPPLGVVQGALDLRQLARIVAPPLEGSAVSVVLVDRDDRLIHSSPELGFAALVPLAQYARRADDDTRGVLAFDVGGRTVEYLHGSVRLTNGWRIYALMDYRALVRELMFQYSGIFLLIGLAIAVSAWLAQRSGTRLAAPLEQLARELAAARPHGVARIGPLRAEASTEVALVHAELARSLAQIERHQGELEEQVAERTRELEEANRQLQGLARVDALTGIENRRGLAERFPLLRATARRAGAQLAVVLVDLDHFKKLNDTHGHLAGDRCLVEIGRMLHESFARETDVVARFGGEEFVIALQCAGAAALATRLEALRARVEATPIDAGGSAPLHITASLGAVVASAEHSTLLAEWLSAADKCLYRAKASGRNAVEIETLGAN